MHRIASFTLVTLLLLLRTTAASADDAADKSTARELAIDGASALEAKDYETAADCFARAEALFHAPTLVLGLARAQAGLGKYVEARESYQAVIREPLDDDASDAFRDAKAQAEKEVVEVEAKIAWIIIRVKGPKDVPGAKLDGEELPAAALGVRRPVNPGEHRLEVSAAGFARGVETFDVTPGEGREVVITLEEAPDDVTQGEEGDGLSPLAIAGIGTLGLGGAALVVGGVMGGLALGKHGDLTDACDEASICPASEQGTLDDFRTFGNASTGLIVAGGVLAAVGVTLLVVGLGDEGDEGPDSARVLRLTPLAAPGFAGLSVQGTF